MAEPSYERSDIIAEVQQRHARSIESGRVLPTDTVRNYFTNVLGYQPISELIRPINQKGIPMDINTVYHRLTLPDRSKFNRAYAYGIAGIGSAQLGEAFLRDYSTEEYVRNLLALFLDKAHLNTRLAEPETPEEKDILRLALAQDDAIVTRRVRAHLTGSIGTTPGRIGDFFQDLSRLAELPSFKNVTIGILTPRTDHVLLAAGRDFQATLDTITSTQSSRPKAIDFLSKFD